jgi:hypothetical protein
MYLFLKAKKRGIIKVREYMRQGHKVKAHTRGGGGAPAKPLEEIEDISKALGRATKEDLNRYKAVTKRRGYGHGKSYGMRTSDLAVMLNSPVKFAILSAGRNPAHPGEAKLPTTHQKFKTRHARLGKDLKRLGYVYTPVVGHYGGQENSYIVAVHDANRDEITALGKKYNQDSVVYSENRKNQMIYTTGENAGKYNPGNGAKNSVDQKLKDYYTTVKLTDDGTAKFNLHIDFGKLETLKSKEDTTMGEEMVKGMRESVFEEDFLKSHELDENGEVVTISGEDLSKAKSCPKGNPGHDEEKKKKLAAKFKQPGVSDEAAERMAGNVMGRMKKSQEMFGIEIGGPDGPVAIDAEGKPLTKAEDDEKKEEPAKEEPEKAEEKEEAKAEDEKPEETKAEKSDDTEPEGEQLEKSSAALTKQNVEAAIAHVDAVVKALVAKKGLFDSTSRYYSDKDGVLPCWAKARKEIAGCVTRLFSDEYWKKQREKSKKMMDEGYGGSYPRIEISKSLTGEEEGDATADLMKSQEALDAKMRPFEEKPEETTA